MKLIIKKIKACWGSMHTPQLLTTNYSLQTTKGFTFIELLITIAIASIMFTIGAISLINLRSQQTLEHETQAIAVLLSVAREKSIGQESSSRWGVHIQNNPTGRDTYALIQVDEALLASSSYTDIPGTASDSRTVPTSVELISPASGASTNIVFQKSSGLPTANATITLQLVSRPSSSYTITVSSKGTIDYQ